MAKNSPFKLLFRKTIIANKWIEVFEDQVEIPDGSKMDYFWSSSGGDGLAVVPVDSDGVWLIRQFKYAVGEYVWSVPAGGVENNEEPLKWAKVELQEEAGLAAKKWTSLGYFYSSPGTYKEKVHMFMAEDLKEVEQKREADEVIEMKKVSFKIAWEMILNNEVTDSFAISALIKTFDRLGLLAFA